MKFANLFSCSTRRLAGLVLALGVLVAFQFWHLYGLHVSKDLPLWDESAYLGWGDEFLQDGKVGSITNAPFYHVLYAMVITAAGLLPGFYVMQYVLKLTLTALVFLLVFPFSRSAPLSLALGVFFAYSYYHLNIDVLVYYSALIPFMAAILVAGRAPGLSLGLSFLAGLGRLEYMAVPVVHLLFLLVAGRTSLRSRAGLQEPGSPLREERDQASLRSRAGLQEPGGPLREERDNSKPGLKFSWLGILHAIPAVAVWLFNLFLLTRITVWQFHNRVWFAWSQNYAFFRYLTGRDTGSNPWLDHQFIAQRDFPNAHSLSEAFSVNPMAVFEHTWFNLRELPGYLAAFMVADPQAGAWRNAPLFVLAAIVVFGLFALARELSGRVARSVTSATGLLPAIIQLRRGLSAEGGASGDCGFGGQARKSTRESPPRDGAVQKHGLALVLCAGGLIAAVPGLIVSSKTNYIMSVVPATLLGLCALHEVATRVRTYAKWHAPGLLGIAALFGGYSLVCVPAYSAKRPRGPVYEDVITMRSILHPFHGLKILGVSTASYVNYLGREKAHVFIEPLAISPINRQADDLSLGSLVRLHDPDVLLINSQWRASKSYASAVEGFSFDGWESHALRDGQLYTKRGLMLLPVFEGGAWYGEERDGSAAWRWSSGDAAIAFEGSVPGRLVTLRFEMRSIVERSIWISHNDRLMTSDQLGAGTWRQIELKTVMLTDSMNRLSFRTDVSGVYPGNGDPRELAFCVRNLEIEYGPALKSR